MDQSSTLNRLTTETLEACLSQESLGPDADELRAFLNAADCDLVRMQFLAVASFLQNDQTDRKFRTLGDVKEFVASGQLDIERAVKVMQACIKFFMVGWHARGAIEDAEKLKGLVLTQ
jgi:hypothetical protein